MFTLTIQVSSIDEAERILAALKHSADPTAVQQVTEQVAEANTTAEPIAREITSGGDTGAVRRRGRAPKEKAVPSGTSDTVEATEVVQQPVDQPTEQPLTIDHAREALKGVQAKYGSADMAKPLELLARFGANRVSEVKAENYADFIAACKAA